MRTSLCSINMLLAIALVLMIPSLDHTTQLVFLGTNQTAKLQQELEGSEVRQRSSVSSAP